MSYQLNTYISTERELPTDEMIFSIVQMPTGFLFTVTTTRGYLIKAGEVRHEGASMSDLMATLRGVVGECEISTIGVASLELVVSTPKFVLIPEHLYEAGNDRAYLESVCHLDAGMTVCSDYIESIKAWSVFVADNNMVSASRIVLPGVRVRCQYSKLLGDYMLRESENSDTLAVHVRKGAADYVVLRNSKPLLANTFVCDGFDDTLYFALDMVNRMGLDAEKLKVMLSGEVTYTDFDTLRHYFGDVRLNNGKPLRILEPEFQHLHSYRYVLGLS
ncbi:MAG: DUF3822 family protein [Bacteroidales bacterium]|nr:DUF3822 family protein [Bacteroidales bacterium]